MKKIILALVVGLSLVACNVFAAPLGNFANWTMIADDDDVVGPGGGGQAFDAEYLFYKLDGTTLSIGLQTGFNVVAGTQTHNSKSYYAGDLALSFDGDVTLGNAGTYEYAFDFGLLTKDYSGNDLGTQESGLYSVTSWNTGVYSGHTISNPFAMSAGSLIGGTITNEKGLVEDSYYRMVSFNLAEIEGLSFSGLDVHWTMSCGNDAIDGSAPVPEPATLILLGSGLAGLAFYRRKMKK